ncbi:hypothetical protein BDY19DRAFT_602113 [Irpex rosettiformis]|uniref:Uncharacterized protein n=1 Tax=Irpex rosettiformis TaxID=378272 RepID=A0ACB8TPV5_9APHY|nr:hypothetical protein BDY19DRAFT_602113 [Irpex rosettiformis]
MERPPSPLVIVPYRPYKLPKKQFGRKHKPPITFTTKGRPGVSLGLSAGAPAGIDYSHQSVFEGCGTKVTFVIQIGKLNPYKPQKYAYSRRNGEQTANNRAKVVKQISEVMEGFIETIRWEQGEGASWFMEGGIKIKDLYLTELRQVGKASFQPIFAVAEEHAIWVNSLQAPSRPLAMTTAENQLEGEYPVDMIVLPRSIQDKTEYAFLDLKAWPIGTAPMAVNGGIQSGQHCSSSIYV